MIDPEDRQMAINLIGEAVTAGARQPKACEVLEINSRTLRRWKQQLHKEQALKDRRKESAAARTPANKLTDKERDEIIETCNQPQFKSLPPSQIVPILADQGRYIASESSFYRVLKEVDQVNRRGRAETPRVVTKPKGYKAEAPNEVWSWDITYLASSIRGMFYYLYLIEDIFSRKIVGWEIHETESAELAGQLIRKTCLAEGIHREGLVLHSDNGSPMKGATMLATLQKLGVVPSFSRPSVSDDNPYSESLFRTMKYSPAYPNKPFEDLDATRKWVYEFVQWYNGEHRHSSIQYVTPSQRHNGQDSELLKKRKAVYELAKEKNPQRKRVFDFVMQNGTSKSPFCTQSSTAYYCPGRSGLQHYAITSQARYCFVAGSRDDLTSRSYAIFGFPLALCARRASSIASRLPGTNRLGFQPSLAVSGGQARSGIGVQ